LLLALRLGDFRRALIAFCKERMTEHIILPPHLTADHRVIRIQRPLAPGTSHDNNHIDISHEAKCKTQLETSVRGTPNPKAIVLTMNDQIAGTMQFLFDQSIRVLNTSKATNDRLATQVTWRQGVASVN
jgi:hypothetical protein